MLTALRGEGQYPRTVGKFFRVGKKIGEGRFGVVFEGVDKRNGQKVAIKLEIKSSEVTQLQDEFKNYQLLKSIAGIPQTHHYGQERNYNVLVTELLGSNLEDLFETCGRTFTAKTVALCALQMITRIQAFHDKGFVYRDIKPDNFLVGSSANDNGTIYIIDLGMASKYQDPETGLHIPERTSQAICGTPRYMSINGHLRREQSRRDDLESLGYVFVYFLRGSLPWQGLDGMTPKQRFDRICELKKTTNVHDLLNGYTAQFATYLHYVRSLNFDEKPNYDYLRDLFIEVLDTNNDTNNTLFDWQLLNAETDPTTTQYGIKMEPVVTSKQQRRKSLSRKMRSFILGQKVNV